MRKLALLLAVCVPGVLAVATAADDSPAPRTGTVTILHTNDWHGYALPEQPRKKRGRGAPRPLQGGVAAMAATMAKVAAEVGAGNVLALDAGDCLSGHPAASLAEDGVVGATFMRAWSGIPYDAWVVGNHDFDAGRKNSQAIVKLATPQCLLANLLKESDGSPLLEGTKPYQVFERGGLRIGVIGMTTPDLARLASGETMAGVRVLKLAEAARPLAQKLEKEADLVVALTHAGVDLDRELARAVPELDVIVGGHSHTRLTKPIVEGTTLVVQAGANGRELGRLDLTVEGGKVTAFKGQLIPSIAEGVTPTAAMVEPLARIKTYINALEEETIGETAQALTRGNYYGETLIGGFIADAVRLATGADVGLVNSGGVRADFPQGKISRLHLLKTIPNDNKLATFECTGAQLEAICLHNARAAVTKDHGVLQVGGLRYRWKRTADGKDAELLKVWVDGKPLEREKKYVVATNDFIANEQGPKYLGFVPAGVKMSEKTMHAAILGAFAKGPIERPDRGRMWEERERKPAAEKKSAPKKGTDDEEQDGADEKKPAPVGPDGKPAEPEGDEDDE